MENIRADLEGLVFQALLDASESGGDMEQAELQCFGQMLIDANRLCQATQNPNKGPAFVSSSTSKNFMDPDILQRLPHRITTTGDVGCLRRRHTATVLPPKTFIRHSHCHPFSHNPTLLIDPTFADRKFHSLLLNPAQPFLPLTHSCSRRVHNFHMGLLLHLELQGLKEGDRPLPRPSSAGSECGLCLRPILAAACT